METRKNVILALAIATVFLVAAVGSASADEQITSLPFTTNADGERYFLTGDLTCTDTTTSAITIANNNVIIDGQGHKITGTVSGTDCAQWDTSQTYPAPHCGVINIANKDNVVIKNLEIENFCTGVALGMKPGAGDTDNNTVTGCKIHNCGKSTVVTHGIQMVWTNNCTITKNEIYEIDGTGIAGGCSGGGNGIFLFGDVGPQRGWYNSITCNNLHHNVKSGFFTKHQCMHNTISYNNATYNTQSGIMPKCEMSNYNEFEYNNMSYNGANGFYLGGDNNIIRYNTMINNGAEGLGLKGTADSNTITNNTACGNGGTGDMAWTNVTNIGDSNTCGSGPAGACDWNCDDLASVYYDFDNDEDCSKEAADCSCSNTLVVGSCCNPGKFNSSGAGQHCIGVCNTSVGNDPNDCDASVYGDPKIPPISELPPPPPEGVAATAIVGNVAPHVCCKWEEPDDQPETPDTTEVIPNAWPDNKTVTIKACVCDGNGNDDIQSVTADVTGPGGAPVWNGIPLSPDAGVECPATDCDCNYEGECVGYSGTFDMGPCDPAGNYTVNVTVADKADAKDYSENQFEYQSIAVLYIDFDAVAYGGVEIDTEKFVMGDNDTATPAAPTVHNKGNDNLVITINATEMTPGNSYNPAGDNVNMRQTATVVGGTGTKGALTPGTPISFTYGFVCCTPDPIDFSINAPPGTKGTYTGRIIVEGAKA